MGPVFYSCLSNKARIFDYVGNNAIRPFNSNLGLFHDHMSNKTFFSAWLMLLSSLLTNHPYANGQSQYTPHTLQLDKGSKAASAELSEFEWLVGRWEGEGLGGQCEEVFLPAWNGTMFGTFRYANQGKLVFSEFFSLVKTEDGVFLKLKHFNPDMVGWEEKDKMMNFPLVKLEKNAVYYGGLTYKLDEQGVLKVWVAMKNNAGQVEEAEFTFRRASLESGSDASRHRNAIQDSAPAATRK